MIELVLSGARTVDDSREVGLQKGSHLSQIRESRRFLGVPKAPIGRITSFVAVTITFGPRVTSELNTTEDRDGSKFARLIRLVECYEADRCRCAVA